MESDIEYIQLFMEYESDDMPVVYFYEVAICRFASFKSSFENSIFTSKYPNFHFQNIEFR
mgnify:CR=1 FL=1